MVDGTDALPPRIDLDRLAQRPGETLEAGFDDVMVVLAIEVLDMQRDSRRLGKGLEPLLEQLSIHLAEFRTGKRHLPHQIGSVRGV